MKKVFRGFILFVIVLIIQLTLLPANEAYANDPPLTFSALDIKVMPEFINPEEWNNTLPSLLVGYHGSVTNETDQPFEGEIIVPIPTNLPQFELGYVAQEVNEEQHLPLDARINEESGYIAISPQQPIEPNETFNFIIEHFSASIEGGVEREFTYQLLSDVEIGNLNLAVYAPFRAENFVVNKEPSFVTSSFGVEIYVYELGNVGAGENLDFAVSYSKDSIVTTVEAFNDFDMPNDDTHAGLNQGNNNPSSTTIENLVLIILTVIIVAAFVYIIIRQKQTANKSSKAISNSPKKIVNKEEELKKLRKMLAEGKIDEKTYKEKRSKLG